MGIGSWSRVELYHEHGLGMLVEATRDPKLYLLVTGGPQPASRRRDASCAPFK